MSDILWLLVEFGAIAAYIMGAIVFVNKESSKSSVFHKRKDKK